MIFLYKNRGKTPLEALTRLRIEQIELADEILSYAGRLDPMAEGILPILVGEEENKNRKDFLEKNKEYEVHFLIGCSTDTYDVLGLIQKYDFTKINKDLLIESVKKLKHITKQTYPWYSSKTVKGIPLFEYARTSRFDIVRPERKVKIYSVSNIVVYELIGQEVCNKNIIDIQNVKGDFRQDQSIQTWDTLKNNVPTNVQLVSCLIEVSSGTYIRSMAETISEFLGVPVVVQKLIRTKVF